MSDWIPDRYDAFARLVSTFEGPMWLGGVALDPGDETWRGIVDPADITDMSTSHWFYDDAVALGTEIPENGTACLEAFPSGLVRMVVNDTCYSRMQKRFCREKICMTKSGRQCVFPFMYRNSTHENITHNECTVADVYRPWCPTSKYG